MPGDYWVGLWGLHQFIAILAHYNLASGAAKLAQAQGAGMAKTHFNLYAKLDNVVGMRRFREAVDLGTVAYLFSVPKV
jgi:hypothetical protein